MTETEARAILGLKQEDIPCMRALRELAHANDEIIKHPTQYDSPRRARLLRDACLLLINIDKEILDKMPQSVL